MAAFPHRSRKCTPRKIDIPDRYITAILDCLDKSKWSDGSIVRKAWIYLSEQPEWWRSRYNTTFGAFNLAKAETSPLSWLDKYTNKLDEWLASSSSMKPLDFAFQSKYDIFERLCFLSTKLGYFEISKTELATIMVSGLNDMLQTGYNREILDPVDSDNIDNTDSCHFWQQQCTTTQPMRFPTPLDAKQLRTRRLMYLEHIT